MSWDNHTQLPLPVVKLGEVSPGGPGSTNLEAWPSHLEAQIAPEASQPC